VENKYFKLNPSFDNFINYSDSNYSEEFMAAFTKPYYIVNSSSKMGLTIYNTYPELKELLLVETLMDSNFTVD